MKAKGWRAALVFVFAESSAGGGYLFVELGLKYCELQNALAGEDHKAPGLGELVFGCPVGVVKHLFNNGIAHAGATILQPGTRNGGF